MVENTKIINLTKHKTPQYITNFWWHKYNHNSAVAEMGDRLATTDMGRKEGAAVPLSVGELHGSPSNTMWPGPRPTSIPSGILIHPAVWPEQT